VIRGIGFPKNKSFFYEGPYFKDFRKNPLGFHFTELVPGLAENTKDEKVLNLISENKKAYVCCQASIYPFLSQIDTILSFYEDQDMINSVELIVDVVGLTGTNIFAWIPEILNNKKIKHTIINSLGYRFLNINNFVEICNQDFEEHGIFRNLYENTLSFVDKKELEKPFRKVLISRKLSPNVWDISDRCDNDEKLEEIFIKNGFEICYPEKQFKTFSEQVTYFNETKVLCGVSGGGLTNSIFMQPKGKIVELATSFRFRYALPEDDVVEELHEYYLHIAWHRKHAITTVSNIDRKADEIEKQLAEFRVFEWLKDND
jgi:capsular polysaccharide biosynthesis protein